MVLLTTKDVAKILNQTPRNIAYLVKSGKLKNVGPESASSFLFEKKEVELMLSKLSFKRSSKNANVSTNTCLESSSLNDH